MEDAEPPVLSVFGGKITTYRRLAEQAMEKLARLVPGHEATHGRKALRCPEAISSGTAAIFGVRIWAAEFPFLSDCNASFAWCARTAR